MAGVITFVDNAIDEIDSVTGMHRMRRSFQYVRDAGDDEIILVNPNSGPTADLNKGFFEAPWAGIACLSAQNNSGGIRQPALPPTLYTALLVGQNDAITIADGQLIDTLAGEDRAWPVSWPSAPDNEVLRTFPVGSQAAGGRTYWMCFASPNALAATWIISMQLMEAA